MCMLHLPLSNFSHGWSHYNTTADGFEAHVARNGTETRSTCNHTCRPRVSKLSTCYCKLGGVHKFHWNCSVWEEAAPWLFWLAVEAQAMTNLAISCWIWVYKLCYVAVWLVNIEPLSGPGNPTSMVLCHALWLRRYMYIYQFLVSYTNSTVLYFVSVVWVHKCLTCLPGMHCYELAC